MTDRIPLLVAVLIAVALAGCIGQGGGADPAGDAGNGSSPTPSQAPAVEDPTNRSHVHDRWDGRTNRTLLDETMTLPSLSDVNRDNLAETTIRTFCTWQRFGLPEGEIVPPGTAKLHVTLDWTDTRPVPEPARPILTGDAAIDLAIMPADAAEMRDPVAVTPGQTRSFDVSVEMADGGHAQASLWQFEVTYCATTPEKYTGLDVDVTVAAERVDGGLPEEPPHPDFWTNTSTWTIARVSGSGTAVGGMYTEISEGGSSAYLGSDDHRIIPPGTKLLVATVNWSNGAPTAGTPADGSPDLSWSNGGWFSDIHDWEPDATGTEAADYVYTLPIDATMTDGMYANRSRWWFNLDSEGSQELPGTVLDGPTTPYVWDGEWELEILAFDRADVAVG